MSDRVHNRVMIFTDHSIFFDHNQIIDRTFRGRWGQLLI